MERLDQASLAWDMPGYGASAPLDGPATADAYVDRLLAALDALHLRDIVLVGSSLGCVIAGRLMARAPNRALGAVLVGPALGYGVAADAPLPESVQARLDALDREGPEGYAAARAARLIDGPERKPDVLAAVRRAMASLTVAGLAPASRLLASADLLADAARIERPVHVLVGAGDVITPPETARRLGDALGTRLAGFDVVPGAGHALVQEAPVPVAEALARLVGVPA